MKLIVRTEVEFNEPIALDDSQLEDLSEHISDEVGSKLLHICIRDDMRPAFIASIGTEAMVLGSIDATVKGCARCGGEHELTWQTLSRPIKLGEDEWTRWAICPATGEPIMMRHVPQVFACKR